MQTDTNIDCAGLSSSEYDLHSVLDEIIDEDYLIHPFSTIHSHANFEVLLANYLAMSQAFPYLQAGSQKDIFLCYMRKNQDIPEHVELTSVVGNFLCWDETGGLYPTIAMGLKALPRILETKRFHANVLKNDCELLLKKKIQPDYSTYTQTYLLNLYDYLAAESPVTRVACMVSFENHANRMIQALWDSLATHFKIEKKLLGYFLMHVGGNDPAEAYHVEMTNRLINKTIDHSERVSFFEQFKNIYSLHYNWCKTVVESSTK